MRSISYSAFLMAIGSFAAASASPQPTSGFIKGQTTVADVERGYGAPADTSMRADGGLTLVYPADRLAGVRASGSPVALVFSANFVLEDTKGLKAAPAAKGYASR